MTLTPEYIKLINEGLILPEPEESGRSFGGARKLLKLLAEELGVNLSDDEDYELLVKLGGAALYDHLADESQLDQITTAFNEIINGQFQDGLELESQIRIYNYFKRLSRADRKQTLELISQIEPLIVIQRDNTEIDELIRVRLEEASIFAGILSLETKNKVDTDAREKFNRWLGKWATAGYLVDSLFDLVADYNNAESKVKPNSGNHIKLGAVASRAVVEVVVVTPPKVFMSAVKNAYKYVIKRVKFDPTKNNNSLNLEGLN